MTSFSKDVQFEKDDPSRSNSGPISAHPMALAAAPKTVVGSLCDHVAKRGSASPLCKAISAAFSRGMAAYAAYRNKPTLLRQVWYATFRGDEEDIRLLDRPEIHAVLAEPDLATRLHAHAVALSPVFRRIAPSLRALEGATTSEPAATAMLAEFDERRLDAARHYARAAATTGQLAVSEDECRDLLAATMDGALWHRLVEERGWSDDRYAQLLGSMWVALLVR
jgi:hypothetical protein